MTAPLPLKRYEQYSASILGENTNEMELHRCIVDMEKIRKIIPSDSRLLELLGIAQFRKGRHREGLRTIRASVVIRPGVSNVNNYILALRQAEEFQEALEVELQHRDIETNPMFGLALAGDYSIRDEYNDETREIIGEIIHEELDQPLTEIARDLFGSGEYGYSYRLKVDRSEKPLTILVFVGIPHTVKKTLEIANGTIASMAKKYSTKVLMHIVPQFRINDDHC
ncbi:MAG: hypothetical protein Q9M26_04505 [Mariprofundales bacterium]|nr:hypothetical protein [Mariprofundales bacterium]